jgi:hypothetical protein
VRCRASEREELVLLDARGAAGTQHRLAQGLVLSLFRAFRAQQHVLGWQGVLIEPVGGIELRSLLRRQEGEHARDQRGGNLRRQKTRPIALAKQDEEEEVGRDVAAALELLKADAQRLALRSGRLTDPPAQVNGLKAKASGHATPAQLRKNAPLQHVALSLEIGKGRTEKQTQGCAGQLVAVFARDTGGGRLQIAHPGRSLRSEQDGVGTCAGLPPLGICGPPAS